MASFSTLPPELIVKIGRDVRSDDDHVDWWDSVHRQQLKEEGGADNMRHLMLLDRRTSELLAPTIWKLVFLNGGSSKRLCTFITDIAPRRGRFIRRAVYTLCWETPCSKPFMWQMPADAAAHLQEVARLCPNIEYWQLPIPYGRDATLQELAPLVEASRQMHTLHLLSKRRPNPGFDLDTASFILLATRLRKLVISLSVGGLPQSERKCLEIISAVRGLRSLEVLELHGCMTIEWSTESEWLCPLKTLYIGACHRLPPSDMATFVCRFRDTLEEVHYMYDLNGSPIPQIDLPKLRRLRLRFFGGPSTVAPPHILLAFSPCTYLEHIHTDHIGQVGSVFRQILAQRNAGDSNLWQHLRSLACWEWSPDPESARYDRHAGIKPCSERCRGPRVANVAAPISRLDF